MTTTTTITAAATITVPLPPPTTAYNSNTNATQYHNYLLFESRPRPEITWALVGWLAGWSLEHEAGENPVAERLGLQLESDRRGGAHLRRVNQDKGVGKMMGQQSYFKRKGIHVDSTAGGGQAGGGRAGRQR